MLKSTYCEIWNCFDDFWFAPRWNLLLQEFLLLAWFLLLLVLLRAVRLLVRHTSSTVAGSFCWYRGVVHFLLPLRSGNVSDFRPFLGLPRPLLPLSSFSGRKNLTEVDLLGSLRLKKTGITLCANSGFRPGLCVRLWAYERIFSLILNKNLVGPA